MRANLIFLFLAVVGLSGCGVMNNNIVMADLNKPDVVFLKDETKANNYPSFMSAEGNIYSCRYGIHSQSDDEFTPPKADIFAALLAKYAPKIVNQKVVLERFDVYYNARLRTLKTAGTGIGGFIGYSIASVGEVNKGVFTFQKLLIDAAPNTPRHPGENQVGCDNENEGEYYASEISGGHDVIVSWFKFKVGRTPYHFRTYYQHQGESKEQKAAAISEAIRMSVEGIATRIKGL